MKHTPSPRSARPWTASTALLAVLALVSLSLAGSAEAREPTAGTITQGTVEFTVDYQDLGAMGAMLPKTERVLFRPGQMRVESGLNVSLYGVEPDRDVSLLALDTHKLAFLIPKQASNDNESGPLRYERMDEQRTIAGLPAHQIDGVDREDETNRLSYWVTDRLAARFPMHGHLPDGFALDYRVIMNDGLAHKVATSIDPSPLDDGLFSIPEDYKRIEVASQAEISERLGEIMGGDIQVIE